SPRRPSASARRWPVEIWGARASDRSAFVGWEIRVSPAGAGGGGWGGGASEPYREGAPALPLAPSPGQLSLRRMPNQDGCPEEIVNTYQNYIGGQDVAAADGRTFTGFNPTTGEAWGTFALAAAAEVDRGVKAAADPLRA